MVLLATSLSFADVPRIETTKLIANVPGADDNFGASVASDGEHAIAGAPFEDLLGNNEGAAYVFRRTGPGTWGTPVMLNSTSAGVDDNLGSSVDISGDFAVAGAPFKDVSGVTAGGAVLVFRKTAVDTWDQGVGLTAPSPGLNDKFGASVGISGDYIIAGAPLEDVLGNDSGAAYVFQRNALAPDPNTWDSVAKLVAGPTQQLANFGFSVDISGDYAIVGAPGEDVTGLDEGAAYVFRRTGPNAWTGTFRLIAEDLEQLANFGFSVDISGDYAIVGAPLKDVSGSDSGAAYIFHRTGTDAWDAGTRISAPAPQQLSRFGASVAINGLYAIVGSPLEDVLGTDEGAVYVFRRTGTNSWDPGTRISASDLQQFARFGSSVDIASSASGILAIVGEPLEDEVGAPRAGSAHTYVSGFTVGPVSGDTSEAGGQATFTVRLNIQPASDVSIGVSSSDPGEGTADVSSLTFTSSDWDTAQTVTVTGQDDLIADGSVAYSILLAPATSSDPRFSGLDPDDVSLTNTDNEPAPSASGGGGGCFIATAAYGSGMSKEVAALRRFRDRHLIGTSSGEFLVKLYYKHSPPLAEFIRGHDSLRFAARLALYPVVLSVYHPMILPALLIAGGSAATLALRRNARRKKTGRGRPPANNRL